ncbi:M20/M25/M40 family metallo-hydrolase [Soonwooa sp.]|uniref:M20/M25/M40 family metallo-hydrolase n=1 Tax=Soonwooa sp. TaxID=1938592 RepID=UPI00262DF84A|nr:M20/M25/M40 family metallo-hydrolase [Soonwooa sp.]
MKKLIFSIAISASIFGFAQSKQDSIAFKNISDYIMKNGQAYDQLYDLTKNIGHRLSGSEANVKAVKWAEQQLKEAGADKVWLEEVMVPNWYRGKESLNIKTGNGAWKSIKMLSLGNSEGTKGKDLTGDLIVFETLEDFEKTPADQIKGKIVLFNNVFPQEYIKTMHAYGKAGTVRRVAAAEVAKKGGTAVIIRSISSAFDDVPHTGAMKYEDGVVKIPAIAIGPKSAIELANLAKQNKLSAKINSNCTMKGEVKTYNVIGELTGKDTKNVIVVGGHLDSWDVGEGAQDDGAGIVQSIEVLSTFKKLNIKNRNTIRVVCFANEENGARGGVAYAKSITDKGEKNIFGIESDSGGFTPRGFSLDMPEAKRNIIKSWKDLFLPYGIYDFTEIYSGTDVDPMKKTGADVAGLVPDSQRYFDIHHTEEDTFDKVNRRELLLGATVMAQLIYMVDQYWK